MVTRVAVCGDSFACGVGLPPATAFEDNFGGLVAKHLNATHNVYARSGCCNFVIYLQVKKVIEQYASRKEKPLVLITTTNHSRFIFPTGNSFEYKNYTLEDVDYLSYMPYSEVTGEYKRSLPFKPNKNPLLVSETVSNVMWYLKHKTENLGKLFTLIKDKLPAVNHYYENLYDDNVKQTYDNALIMNMHLELKHAGFEHIIIHPQQHPVRFIDPDNLLISDWGNYIRLYPDADGSGHCDERGHKAVANAIILKLEQR